MARVLLCFGDSNTHGMVPKRDPDHYARYGSDTRWPRVAGAALGHGWEIVEDGLPGRTAQFADPEMGGIMDGRTGLEMALRSHGPIDVLAVMLGTNDVKARFAARAELVTRGIEALLDIAQDDELQARHVGFETLVICPPPVRAIDGLSEQFLGGPATSAALPGLYRELARNRGVGYVDAGEIIAASMIDGIHLDAAEHIALGRAIAAHVQTLGVV